MRVWTCQRKQQQYGDAILPIDIITTPDNTLIFVPIYSPDDEGRAAFIVSACNAAEQRPEFVDAATLERFNHCCDKCDAERLERDRAVIERMPHNVDKT